jgi:5-methylcytosine-specific restriction endonuclease McrA
VILEWERRPRHRDPIFDRDGWRCAVPACTARTSLHDHHVVYRSRGGANARDNRVAICAAHHLNGIHKLRIQVAGVAPHDLRWEIGFRRGRRPLMRTHGDRYLDA